MDSIQRARQTNGKLFSNFKLVFELMAKNRKIFNREQGWVYASEVGKAFVLISTRSSFILVRLTSHL